MNSLIFLPCIIFYDAEEGKAYYKPEKRIERTNLSENISEPVGIIPYVPLKPPIYNQPYSKLIEGYNNGTKKSGCRKGQLIQIRLQIIKGENDCTAC